MKHGDFALRSERSRAVARRILDTLRSERSRAVARRILEQRQRSRERLEIIIGRYDSAEPHASPWRNNGEAGQVCRMISIPEGMTLADG